MNRLSSRAIVLLSVLATLVLTGASLIVIVLTGIGPIPSGNGFPGAARCTVPALTGTLVSIMATDVGGPMMSGFRRVGGMRLTADRATVQHGQVSFLVTNAGRLPHEMVILPLPGSQMAGTLVIGADGKVNEASSLGAAASTCAEGEGESESEGEGEGEGILSGSSSWVTVDLPPGRYELVCNLPGHYGAGMYTQLTVI